MHLSKIKVVLLAIFGSVLLFVACMSGDKDKKVAESKPVKFANDSFKVRPLTDITYERTAERLKQGEYLANGILMCFTCHSPRNWNAPGAPLLDDKKGSGGTIVNQDSTSLVIAPNITPDKETGAGTWTDDMIGRAIREGVGHDGRALSWQMPFMIFKNLSDEDLASVVVYLRSLSPIHNVVQQTKIPQAERLETQKILRPITEPVPTPDQSDPVKRGQYLVRIGECVGCHTGGYQFTPGLFGGGNFAHRYQNVAFSANITTDSSGISYGENGFLFVMKTGKGGTLSPVMPWLSFKNMKDEDLKAIYAYLKTLPKVSHYVNSQQPFTDCVLCGMKHGLGDRNVRRRPAGITIDPGVFEQYVGTYQEDEWKMTLIVKRSGKKLVAKNWDQGPEFELVPQSETHFVALGLPLPLTFVKDEQGKVVKFVEDTDYGRVYKKIAN